MVLESVSLLMMLIASMFDECWHEVLVYMKWFIKSNIKVKVVSLRTQTINGTVSALTLRHLSDISFF